MTEQPANNGRRDLQQMAVKLAIIEERVNYMAGVVQRLEEHAATQRSLDEIKKETKESLEGLRKELEKKATQQEVLLLRNILFGAVGLILTWFLGNLLNILPSLLTP